MNILQWSLLQNAGCAGGCKFCGLSVDAEIDRQVSATEVEFQATCDQARRDDARMELVFATVAADQRQVFGFLAGKGEVIAANPDVELAINPGICTRAEFYAQLAAHGIDRYRNNLETSRRLFRELVPGRPRAQDLKLESLALARVAGLKVDTGWLCGLGESDEDIADVLDLLKQSQPDSITLNFFDPRETAEAFDHTEPSVEAGRHRLSALRERFPEVEITLGGAYELWLGVGAPEIAQADGIYVGRFLDHGLRQAEEAKLFQIGAASGSAPLT